MVYNAPQFPKHDSHAPVYRLVAFSNINYVFCIISIFPWNGYFGTMDKIVLTFISRKTLSGRLDTKNFQGQKGNSSYILLSLAILVSKQFD